MQIYFHSSGQAITLCNSATPTFKNNVNEFFKND